MQVLSSTMEIYLRETQEQLLAKQQEENGLDPDLIWISVNALVLIGCLNCSGKDIEKADVFYRVVQPEMLPRIYVSDRDIRMSLLFMINMATILFYMQGKIARDGHDTTEFDVEFFKRKMFLYEIVFEAIIEQFDEDMFGPFENSISRERFKHQLAQDGWKYFDRRNLNQLFAAIY